MSKLSLPALARAINELSAEVEALRSRPEPTVIPADMARLSDIPEPPDLLPLAAKIQELQRQIAEVSESVPSMDGVARMEDVPGPVDLAPIMQRIPEMAAVIDEQGIQISAMREDLSETRRWLSDLGRGWQTHKASVAQQVQAIEARIGQDMAGLADIKSTINEIIGGDE